MKTKLLTLGALTFLITVNTNSQTISGGGAVPGGTASGGAGVQVNPSTPPIPPNGAQPPDNVRRRVLLSPNGNPNTGADSSGNVGVQSGATTSQTQFNTNQLVTGGTNLPGFSTNLSPTSIPGATNRLYGTNSLSVSNSTSVMMKDQALTEIDQRLILRIRQKSPKLSPNGQWSTVSFFSRNGVVTAVGTVNTMEEDKEIVSLIQETPGVVRVNDQMSVSARARQAATGAAATSDAVGATGAGVDSSSSTDTSVQRGVTTTTTRNGPSDNKVDTGFTTQTSPFVTRPSGYYTSGVATATAATNQAVPGQPLPGTGAAVAPTSNPNMTNRIYNNPIGTNVNPAVPGQPPAIPGQPR